MDSKPNYSAGILPYAKYKNKVYFLIGKDRNDNTWSDFGGRSEMNDGNSFVNTASREFYEETIGSVVDIEVIRKRLSSNENNYIKIESNTLNGSRYVMLITQIPYKNYKVIFNKTYSFIKYYKINKKYLEKVDMKWVSLETLLDCIDDNNDQCILRNVFRSTLQKCIPEIKSL